MGLPPRSRGWILLMQKHPLVHSFKTPTEETHTWGNPTDQQMQPQQSNVTSTNVWHRRQGKPPTSHPARPRPKQTLPAFSRKIVTVVVGPNRQQVLNLNVWMGRQLASRLKSALTGSPWILAPAGARKTTPRLSHSMLFHAFDLN